MPQFLASKTDTTDEIFALLDKCSNTTVGPNKYQLFCLTTTDLDGSCRLLPSSLTSSGSLNCTNVVSQKYLNNLYDITGMACAVSCYYPIDILIPLPDIEFPTYTYKYPVPTYSYSYNYPTKSVSNDPLSLSYAAPSAPTQLSGSNMTDPSFSSAAPSAPTQLVSGSNMMDPSFMFTMATAFAIMLLFVRRAI